MAQIILDIPDNKVNDILDAFATQYGWNVGMGVTKAIFAKTKVIEYVKGVYKTQLGITLNQQSHTTIQQSADAIVIT